MGLALPEQLRQPRDVDGDPPRFVGGEHLRLPRLGLVVSRIDVRDRLPVGVSHDVAARYPVGKRRVFISPRRVLGQGDS